MTERVDELFDDGDEVLFASENEGGGGEAPADAWKLLIADDDEEVHALTRLVLSGFSFEGRGVTFLSAYSGRETAEIVREHPDTALILLDVVMERDDAGLQAVRHIREDLDNHFVRIILRTGQPGQAPEQEVVSSYDINDYKAKTELTSQKLYTTVTAALRAYRDIRTIERHRSGLELLNECSGRLFETAEPREFRSAALRSLGAIIAGGRDLEQAGISGIATCREEPGCRIVGAIGSYAGSEGRLIKEVLSPETYAKLDCLRDEDEEVVADDWYAVRFTTPGDHRGLFYLESGTKLDAITRELLDSYAVNLRIALQNLHLNLEVIETQREMIHTLGSVVESRSLETGNHVKRVAHNSYLLAKLAGLDEKQAQVLQMATPLHDVGKIAIPDAVLNKSGNLTPDERELMQKHTEIGRQILDGSNREVLRAAAVVAGQHHEKWDGTGYPDGLSGEDIDIFGRIVGLMDVFDALASDRIYKQALSLEECMRIIREESGRHFDPRLVDLFLENIERFADGERKPEAEEEMLFV